MQSETHYTQAGIYDFYFDARDQKQQIAPWIKEAIYQTFDGKTDTHFEHLAPVFVYYQHQPLMLPLKGHGTLQGTWRLILENGETFEGTVMHNVLPLPSHLPLGYHEIILTIGHITEKSRLIIAPKRCYQPDAILRGDKLWGTFLQLYTLKTERNWGIGDFADLAEFIRHFAPFGASFIGLNPLHSLFPNNPEGASPYSPSSRLWLNWLYIAVDQLPEFAESKAKSWWQSEQVTQRLIQLRQSEWVDYQGVADLKMPALTFCFEAMKKNKERHQKWQKFVENRGKSLYLQATFDALQAELHKKQPTYGWHMWEEKFQDPNAPAIQQFQKTHKALIEFYTYLQFCADEQLNACQALCDKHQMTLGLYRDLAVGASPGGAETWQNQQAFALKASVGAPPDVLAPQGQNWGLSAMNPHVLKQQGYQPFIDLVRANMQHCGALRIDHIMGLLRLWWIPEQESPNNGAYVAYPVDDLLAILALESQRHQRLVIGEDLGIVPDEIVKKLKETGVFSYKIFYFEFDEYGSRHLDYFPKQAMTTLSTHDLPTLRGYWQGKDFELGRELGVYPDEEVVRQLEADRLEAKRKFLYKMQYFNETLPAEVETIVNQPITKEFNHLLQKYVSRVASQLFGFQVEDWLNMLLPVNIPGTTTGYPNWRRKLSHNIEEIFRDESVIHLLKAIHQRRK